MFCHVLQNIALFQKHLVFLRYDILQYPAISFQILQKLITSRSIWYLWYVVVACSTSISVLSYLVVPRNILQDLVNACVRYLKISY